MSGNKSIRGFFRPRTSGITGPVTSRGQAPKEPPLALSASHGEPHSPPSGASRSWNSTSASEGTAEAASTLLKNSAASLPDYSSSLSSPPSTDPLEPSHSLVKETIPEPQASSFERVIDNTDDEAGDSDSSLEDLGEIIAAKLPELKSEWSAKAELPSTPKAARHHNVIPFHPSPYSQRYKYDLETLVSHAKNDEAREASSKRVKAMLASQNENEDSAPEANEEASKSAVVTHSALLDSVAAEREDGGAHKVKRAVMRTEATLVDNAWYFFDTGSPTPRPGRTTFPTASLPKNWQNEFSNPQMRYQTFVSGFAEHMIHMGYFLPDEVFLWMLDEVCFESSDPLRHSYISAMTVSVEQVHRLLLPKVIEKLFHQAGGSKDAVLLSKKIKPIQKLSEPYSNQEWPNIISLVGFFGRAAVHMEQISQTYSITMLLRLCLDQVVMANIDLLDKIQTTIGRLCQCAPDRKWDSFCQEIIRTVFETVDEAPLRLQIVHGISSTTPRSHDLRRRLASCFFFSSLTYSASPSYDLISLSAYSTRLSGPDFLTTPSTDYRALTALISLLDISLDDGRSSSVSLSTKSIEDAFNSEIDALAAQIKNIMRSIGNPGAAFLSRIEAKEALELVSQRISETVRSKPKPKHAWFDGTRGLKEEDLDAERKGMESFVAKMKKAGNTGDCIEVQTD